MAKGRLNRSEPRNNMIYVSYEFYLIHLLFTLKENEGQNAS